VVFDPHCGGTGSLKAALKLGHSFYGFENDSKQIKKYEKVVKEHNKEMDNAVRHNAGNRKPNKKR
jgi:hypothetical protein